jgi:glucose-6-phosphate isomerase
MGADLELSPTTQPRVRAALEELAERRAVGRLWDRDATLWKSEPEHVRIIEDALGWLTVGDDVRSELGELAGFVDELREDGYAHAVLLGMGGSSLAPEVLRKVFGVRDGYLDVRVLDSTDPAAVLALEEEMDLCCTLFIVSSKSGGTTETASFHAYFYDRLTELEGLRAGEHFIAITDEGTSLQQEAIEQCFRAVFVNPSDIGGRYSALSFFGIVPAALMGIDLERLLEGASEVGVRCADDERLEENPGAVLGAAIGAFARDGRDKVTLIASPPIAPFGAWVEQLLAESTGKEGKGVLPVDLEPMGRPDDYGEDRLFVYLRLEGGTDELQEAGVAALTAAGRPVLTVRLSSEWELGGEFLRWEVATALAGALIGIDAFDQPNVQESKDNTKRLLEGYTESGALPEPPADVTAAVEAPGLSAALDALLVQARAGDYVCLQAYVTPDSAAWAELERARLALRRRARLATTAGYGPRFLHSTGQYHKGGPNTGLYLQLVAADARDAPIPGHLYSFGTLKRAQAEGDLLSLRSHGRRVLRVELGADQLAGLRAVSAALGGGEEDLTRDAVAGRERSQYTEA